MQQPAEKPLLHSSSFSLFSLLFPSFPTLSHILCTSLLQCQRSSAGVFAGKYGLITLRDLFKWAGRYALTEGQDRFNDWEQTLAEDGEEGRRVEVHGEEVAGSGIHFVINLDG